jgi:hypothetical protein
MNAKNYLPKILTCVLIIGTLFSCGTTKRQTAVNQPVVKATVPQMKIDGTLKTMGRTEISPEGNVVLIGSAAMAEFRFSSKNEFQITLKSLNEERKHAYVVFELDGKEMGRKPVYANETTFAFNFENKNNEHSLKIFKATEAANGGVEVLVPAQFLQHDASQELTKKIEFIGNSITCGMSNDLTIPCDSGEWFDHHNAYHSYATQVARALGVDFQLSSVSGIGMYRNWNDDHINEPIMPDVYGNLWLNTNSSKPYDFSFKPDIISICLGTNDLSDGDGKKSRLSFSEEKFVASYINFIKMLYAHHPNAQIVLLNSPMVTGEKHTTMDTCLEKVQAAFAQLSQYKPIQIFHFSNKIIPHGCGYHPDIQDDAQMKDELLPFFLKL